MSEPHSKAFADAITDTSKSTDDGLAIFMKNIKERSGLCLLAYSNPDSADIEPYHIYVDWSNATEIGLSTDDKRTITVDIDVWDNSDKNFIDDNPNKGEDIITYDITVVEIDGRDVITDIDSTARH